MSSAYVSFPFGGIAVSVDGDAAKREKTFKQRRTQWPQD